MQLKGTSVAVISSKLIPSKKLCLIRSYRFEAPIL